MILWTNGQGLIDCDSYWFVPAELPILCEYNLNEGKIIRSVFLNNYTAQIGFHYALEKINNKIVLIPARDMNIYVYNLEDDTLTALPMEGNEDDSEKYVCCAKYGENIYMFPRSRATIIRFNVETMKIDYINSKCMENEITDNKLSTNFSTILNNKVYIVMLYSNRICVFDMEKETEKVVEIGDKDMRIKSICCNPNGQIVWMNNIGEIIVANSELRIIEKRTVNENVIYSGIVSLESGYLLFPYDKNQSICNYNYDKNEKSSIDYQIPEAEWVKNWQYTSFGQLSLDEEKIAVFNLIKKKLFVIQKNSIEISEKSIELKEYNNNLSSKLIGFKIKKGQNPIKETQEEELKDFINYINEII